MNYHDQILNHTERPLLPADQADARIGELESQVAALKSTVRELQEIIKIISPKKDTWAVQYNQCGQKEMVKI